jgi:hypothetical protein
MVRIPRTPGWTARLVLAALILPLAFGTYALAQGQRYESGNAWSFGVMGDTQWTNATDPEGVNPDYISMGIASKIQQQLIDKHVKFVMEPGDLSDRAGNDAMYARAAGAQPIFDAGIGFFPLRGNHETYGYLYGLDPNYDLNVPAFKAAFPQTQGGGPYLFGATNFSWPNATGDTKDILKGLSYSFDYNNARFVIVDVEQTSVKHQAAPNNPASCVTAVTPGTPAGTTPYCGQGYYYILADDLGGYNTTYVVYQAAYDITNGYTVLYDSAANTGATVNITISAGTWFRIASNGRPSTNFYAWDMRNPDEMYLGAPFDIYDPVGNPENRVLYIDSSANTEFFPGKQQTWINQVLDKSTRGTDHAFVLSHRGTLLENHVDCFFGTDPSATPADQNAFFASLMNNDVKYMISAHDHMDNRAIVASPDGLSSIHQIITIAGSSKFYTPSDLSSFPAGVKARETEIAQETLNTGYYIYTIDGPRLTVDYYSDIKGHFMDDADYPYGDASVPARLYTPQFHFVKKETFGYGLNGKEFLVKQGDSYSVVQDSYNTTEAAILAGTNGSTTVDGNGRALTKDVNTGWAETADAKLASNILSLWGLTELGSAASDPYVLQLKYDDSNVAGFGNGGYRLAALNGSGQWVNAVDVNVGSPAKHFVKGPYSSGYPVGTYGIDVASKTVWAVLNYDADFAVGKFELGMTAANLVYNRATKTYNGTLTIANNGDEKLGEVLVSFTGLPNSVALLNPAGTDNGSPYILVTFPLGLKPGQSIAVPVSFNNPSNAKIDFVPVSYRN